MIKIHRLLWGLPLLGLFWVDAIAAKPEPWEMNFQAAVTPVMEKIHDLHHLIMIILVVIAVFVLGILGFIIFKFRASRHPNPSTRAHNTLLEIVWTAIPVLILVVIAVPSFKLIFYEDKATDPEMTLKVTGHMWYWSYEYPEHKVTFDKAWPVTFAGGGQPGGYSRKNNRSITVYCRGCDS
jgi:cytochrome c oxidase subunit II